MIRYVPEPRKQPLMKTLMKMLMKALVKTLGQRMSAAAAVPEIRFAGVRAWPCATQVAER